MIAILSEANDKYNPTAVDAAFYPPAPGTPQLSRGGVGIENRSALLITLCFAIVTSATSRRDNFG